MWRSLGCISDFSLENWNNRRDGFSGGGHNESKRVRFSVEKELNRWVVSSIEAITGEEPNHWVEVPVAAKLEIMLNRYQQPALNMA